MPVRFATILLPVDFSVNTDIAIAKALELADPVACRIHLFHVQQIVLSGIPQYIHYYATGYSRREINAGCAKAMEQLQKLKMTIEENRPGVKAYTSVKYGIPVEEAIGEKARKLQPDLIIIGKHSHHSFFPFLNTVVPSRLASAAGVPVLLAKPGSMHAEIKTIVLPVGNQFPVRKLEILEALRKRSKLQVRLVTFRQDENDPSFSRQSLLSTFRTLKNTLTIPVDYEVIPGRDKAKALLRYANKVGADILIVDTVLETRISGWINRHISDLLPADSRTQVLSVQTA